MKDLDSQTRFFGFVKSGLRKEAVDIRVKDGYLELRGVFPFSGRFRPWLRRPLSAVIGSRQGGLSTWNMVFRAREFLFDDGKRVTLATPNIARLERLLRDATSVPVPRPPVSDD